MFGLRFLFLFIKILSCHFICNVVEKNHDFKCQQWLFFVDFFRRVHITRATLLQLGDRFEVEPGDGMSREGYLADHKIETFLIVPPKVSMFYVFFIFAKGPRKKKKL